QDLVGVGGQLGQLAPLRGQDAQDSVGVPEGRIASPDDLLEVLPLSRKSSAEVVQDQAEPLRVRLTEDVADQIRLDARTVLLNRNQVLAGAGLAVSDLPQRRRRL